MAIRIVRLDTPRSEDQGLHWIGLQRLLSPTVAVIAVMLCSCAARPPASGTILPRIKAVVCQDPRPPAESVAAGQEGKVHLAFLISSQGKVLLHEIRSSSGYPLLDKAAAESLGRCDFYPGTQDGVAKEMWTELSYTWIAAHYPRRRTAAKYSVPCGQTAYPPESLRAGEEGTVLLALHISKMGELLETTVKKSSGYPALDAAAVKTLEGCRFKPLQEDGVPADAWSTIKVTWKSSEANSTQQ